MQTKNGADIDSVMKRFAKYTKHVDGCVVIISAKHYIFPFADVTEDVRVNKKLDMSLKGKLASS